MDYLELFKDFMSLGYVEGQRQGTLKDVALTSTVFLRKEYLGDTIHYLDDGSSLFIPWVWCDIFHQFYIYSGCDDAGYSKACCNERDKLGRFIALSTKAQMYISGVLSEVDGSEYLETMGCICDMGTAQFRKWISEKYGIRMMPFEYRSIKRDNLEI